jgi:hypothetical protein
MHLAEVWQARLFSSKIPMSNGRPGMSISFNAMTRYKHDLSLRVLAEIVLAVGRHRHDRAFERRHRVQIMLRRRSEA